MRGAALLRAAALLAAAWPGGAQKGIGSLNDPCDCMQHHDFWMSARKSLGDLFSAQDFPSRMFDPDDVVHKWIRVQSCMYSPENEESHRPTALSDCIPGFLLVHIVCMQRQLAERRPERVMDYAAELVRLLPWGSTCIDSAGWPLTRAHVLRYYRRVRRAYAAGPPPGEPWPLRLLQAMAWSAPSEEELAAAREPGAQAAILGEEAEVCPFGALPDVGVCWILGPPGADCAGACAGEGMQFRAPAAWPVEPLVPRIIGMTRALPDSFLVQHEWGPYECFVSGEHRFHLALPQDYLPVDWRYPVCELACPCVPEASAAMLEALLAVPEL